MKREDQDRLDREASIASAKRGPDYGPLLRSISSNKAEAGSRKAAREAYLAQRRFGYQKAKERGEVSGPFREDR